MRGNAKRYHDRHINFCATRSIPISITVPRKYKLGLRGRLICGRTLEAKKHIIGAEVRTSNVLADLAVLMLKAFKSRWRIAAQSGRGLVSHAPDARSQVRISRLGQPSLLSLLGR